MRFHDKIDFKLLDSMFKDEFEYEQEDVDFLYNFIPKFIIISIALTMQKKLSLVGDGSEKDKVNQIWDIWENNNMQTLKYEIAKHFFLYNQVNLEAVLEDTTDKISGTKIILHHPSAISIEKVANEIVKVEIQSEIFIDGKKVQTKKILTEDEIITKIGDKEERKPNLYDGIPFIRIDNENYRIIGLIRLQDRLNLYESYLDVLFDLHADPILYDDLGEAFMAKQQANKETKIIVSKDKRKIRKFLHYPRDSKGLNLLESNGAMAERIQVQQDKINKTIEKLFPEVVLMDILKAGGQITGPGLEKKLIEISSHINLARGALKNGLEELNELISWLIFDQKIKTQIEFEPITPRDFDDVINEVTKVSGILSKKWQLEKLQKEGIINNAEEEMKNLEKENQASPLGW
ncbi:hypothetical protein XO10_00605 [Marinitoga sp. 1135]|uniref:hypothetical protein n=1 Tax=Marinitoga sp. 1135 TaxID=1643333 RepID=UPI001585D9FC|nr:hypothetical protein [Marinitoga sp. 1135]NUU94819.1 hypothetical protein [Marinitoga sp. 1135]